jgi:secondary thiamine-phosphate synthase enzyme
MKRCEIRSTRREEFIDITPLIRDELHRSGTRDGLCAVHCPHTTAGLTVNEHADPSVAEDILAVLDRLVLVEGPWTHLEGNSPAHVKASLVGSSVQLLISNGDLALGTWQGVFLCEFDGPRAREVWLCFVP